VGNHIAKTVGIELLKVFGKYRIGRWLSGNVQQGGEKAVAAHVVPEGQQIGAADQLVAIEQRLPMCKLVILETCIADGQRLVLKGDLDHPAARLLGQLLVECGHCGIAERAPSWLVSGKEGLRKGVDP
jgi:hypothetical protein